MRRLTLLILILPVLWISCMSHRGRVVNDRHVQEKYASTLKEAVIHIEGVSVSRSFDREKIAENSRYILNLLFQKRNDGKAEAPILSLQVCLKEDSFILEFRAWNTVTVEFALFDGKTPVFTGIYSEETESTLSSYPYLYSLLDRATREVR